MAAHGKEKKAIENTVREIWHQRSVASSTAALQPALASLVVVSALCWRKYQYPGGPLLSDTAATPSEIQGSVLKPTGCPACSEMKAPGY